MLSSGQKAPQFSLAASDDGKFSLSGAKGRPVARKPVARKPVAKKPVARKR